MIKIVKIIKKFNWWCENANIKCVISKKIKITSTDYELFERLKGDMYKIYNNIVLKKEE